MAELLLDTHAFLWLVGEPQRLSQAARAALHAPQAVRLLSIASVWEMAIKQGLGKLILPAPPAAPLPLEGFLLPRLVAHRISLLEIEVQHIFRTQTLPQRHKDPFDRLIVCQALERACPLITQDGLVQAYAQDGLSVIW